MRINHKILSIPPYISTAWKNIASVHAEEREGLPLLVITLHTGFQIEVPGLQPFMIEAIFTAHAAYMEQEQLRPIPQRPIPDPVASQNESTSFSFPVLKIGVNGVDHLNGFMQHNLEQSDSPDLPSELLNKIATIAKANGFDSNTTFPEQEPHCNCPHFQIARTIKTAASDQISEMD